MISRSRNNVLKALIGPAFDQEFARLMVADHQKAVALMEKASKSAGNVSINQWASAKVSALEKHLKHAKSLLERKE